MLYSNVCVLISQCFVLTDKFNYTIKVVIAYFQPYEVSEIIAHFKMVGVARFDQPEELTF